MKSIFSVFAMAPKVSTATSCRHSAASSNFPLLSKMAASFLVSRARSSSR